jgi:hypothetical protein
MEESPVIDRWLFHLWIEIPRVAAALLSDGGPSYLDRVDCCPPRKSSSIWGLVVGLFVCSTAAFGSAHAQQITISGVVVERSESVPVAGATVRVLGFGPYSTDLNGRFQIRHLAPGPYTVSVEAIGYRSFSLEIVVRADTTLQLELERDPVVLDSLIVRSETVTIKGSIRDAATGLKLLHGQVTINPGARTVGSLSGNFTLEKVPRGSAITIFVEAIEYLPARIDLVAESDTTVNVPLKIDSVALRLIAQQVERIERRSQAVPYSIDVLNRDDIRRAGVLSIGELVKRRLPIGVIPERPPYPDICVIFDEARVRFERLLGTPPELIERIEIFGYDAKMIRVYTKTYVARLIGETIPTIRYSDNGLHTVCL